VYPVSNEELATLRSRVRVTSQQPYIYSNASVKLGKKTLLMVILIQKEVKHDIVDENTLILIYFDAFITTCNLIYGVLKFLENVMLYDNGVLVTYVARGVKKHDRGGFYILKN
jgi:hypothetical protein